MAQAKPICHIVAGPNGSGKSTFALRYLPEFAGSIVFVNPDLMAQGMSPTDIRLSAIGAGRQTLERIDELIAAKTDFGFETTLSGRGYLKLLAKAKAQGYRIFLYYLWMPSAVMLPSAFVIGCSPAVMMYRLPMSSDASRVRSPISLITSLLPTQCAFSMQPVHVSVRFMSATAKRRYSIVNGRSECTRSFRYEKAAG